MSLKNDESEILERSWNFSSVSSIISRREFIFISGAMAIASFSREAYAKGLAPLIIIDDAKGLIIGDPTKCVGCRRCELACTEFNDGKASPTIARIKITQNLNFGQDGARAGQHGHGVWGNGLVFQDICRQCPHPVPCATACPNDAIVLDPRTNARIVDPDRCVGCKLCQGACPWGMMSFDSDTNKATKCFLCDGNPKCVAACPAEALSYVSWRNLTGRERPKKAFTAVVPPDKAGTCNDCHVK